MRILFLASRFPRPPFKGDQSRAFHQLRLLNASHDVTFVTFAERDTSSAELDTVRSICKRLIVIARSRLARANLLRAPFTRLPLQTLLRSSRAYRAAVDRELKTGHYDLVHVQLVRMCPYVAGASIPKVVDLIDAISTNMERRSEGESPLLKPLVRLEMRRVRAYEREICETFDQAIVVSPFDRAAIGDYPNLHIIPIGVEPEALKLPSVPREKDLIVFTGTMNYFPNVEAAQYLVDDILPLIRRRRPAARVQIVGANPTKSVRDLQKVDGVEVTGSVPSVFPYLQRASVALSPMQFGSRVQFKILEAMAVYTPVVATLARDGLEVEPGIHLLAGSDAATIAEHVTSVLSDPALAARIGQAGGKLVRAKYTWEASVAALERLYAKALSGRLLKQVRNTERGR